MLTTRFERFDWDAGNRGKCLAHAYLLARSRARCCSMTCSSCTTRSIRRTNGQDEQRYIAAGPTRSGRYLFVAYTLRTIDERTALRPITARYMHKDEAERYEQARTGL